MPEKKKVAVITGGGSGMGLEAAKFMSREKIIVLSGRTQSKLEKGVAELKSLGFEACAKTCDTSVRESVGELAQYAASLGEVTNVINAAGISPSMAGSTAENLLRINALGTAYINQEFYKVMHGGSAILDVSSCSAYFAPDDPAVLEAFGLIDTDDAACLKAMVKLCGENDVDPQLAAGRSPYIMSKKFVIWYARKCAFAYADKGVRVVSLSPGMIDTPMGEAEKTSSEMLVSMTASKRMGSAAELGYALATAVDERNGYLTAVDVLCDGGSIMGMANMMAQAQK